MSNYRVRQVLALGPMPERQLRFLVALATWMSDHTRTVRVGFGTLITDTGNSHNTVRTARRELESAGKLSSTVGRGPGNLTVWVALCLPETAGKGTNEVDPFSADSKGTSEVGTFTPPDNSAKGTNCESVKVPTEAPERYQPEFGDQREPNRGLNRRAKPLGQKLSGRAREDQSEDMQQPDPLSPDAILGDPGRGSPQRARKQADLNGDRPIPVDLSAVDADTEAAAERELRRLAGDSVLPDGWARRTAAGILSTAPQRPRIPAAYVTTVIRSEPASNWLPRQAAP